jgi:hypothetical protein
MGDAMPTSNVALSSPRPGATRTAGRVMALIAIGEMSVAVAILVAPREVALLLADVALEGRALLIARMLGVALLALGVTWWQARGDAERLSRYAAGFIVYNVGVGALFGWAALGASHIAIPWLVCVVHLTAGVAWLVLTRRGHALRETP